MASTDTAEGVHPDMEPYARQARSGHGWDAGLILAQWGIETGWGTEMSTENNFGNIGNTTTNPHGGAGYPTIEAGVQAYINYINSSPYLANVKAAGPTFAAQARALGEGSMGSTGPRASTQTAVAPGRL